MIKRILIGVLILAVAVAGYFIIRRMTMSEEDRVREVIDTLISAVETDHILFTQSRLADNLSNTYRHRGEKIGMGIDKDWTIAFVCGHKQKADVTDFRVEIRTMAVTMDPDGETARVEVTGRITAAKADDPNTRVERMTQPGRNHAIIDLKKENGDWMVVGSELVKRGLNNPPTP